MAKKGEYLKTPTRYCHEDRVNDKMAFLTVLAVISGDKAEQSRPAHAATITTVQH